LLKENVFNSCQGYDSNYAETMFSGRLFQIYGAASKNALPVKKCIQLKQCFVMSVCVGPEECDR